MTAAASKDAATSKTNRIQLAEAAGNKPNSLVGSFFHGDKTHQWQGCVVAEVQPGIYLVELFEWFIGQSSCQQLVRIEDMFEWQFYDTSEWMNGNYELGRYPWKDEEVDPPCVPITKR